MAWYRDPISGEAVHVYFNGVDLSAHVETVTWNLDPGPVTLFIEDPTEEALRELLALAGITQPKETP